MSTKPYPCPNHPDGLIRHTFDVTQAVLNGLPSGEGVQSNHKWVCNDCGMELQSLDEFVEQSKCEERLAKDFNRAMAAIANGWTLTELELSPIFERWWKSTGQFVCASGQPSHKATVHLAWLAGWNSHLGAPSPEPRKVYRRDPNHMIGPDGKTYHQC